MFWPAQIVAEVDGQAVAQVPGGTFLVPDPDGALRVGDSTIIIVTPPGQPPPPGLQLGTWTAQRAARALMLTREAGPGLPALQVLLQRAPELDPDLPGVLQLTLPLATRSRQTTVSEPTSSPTALALEPVTNAEALLFLLTESLSPEPQ